MSNRRTKRKIAHPGNRPVQRQFGFQAEGEFFDLREIFDRMNEISFNSSLMREMRAVAFVTRLIDEGKIKEGSMKRMLIHSIAAEDFMQRLGVNSKMNADWEFLTHLRDAGRERASEWLAAHFQHLAKQSSTDFEVYL